MNSEVQKVFVGDKYYLADCPHCKTLLPIAQIGDLDEALGEDVTHCRCGKLFHVSATAQVGNLSSRVG